MTKQYIAVLISLLVLISGNTVFAQTQFVSGKVIDAATGKVIPGVNVFESNFNGATTNSSGKFKIELDTGLTQLKFSFIGYQFKSVKLKVDEENDDLLVRLIPKDFDLKTVVVSASKRSQDIYEVPVSIEILPAKLIETKNTANIEDALQQVPSVNILDGQANIRGGSGFSYGAGSRVLVLVDDMPMLSGDASDVKWNYLPVENINQIEVLKGASSALYGSAALNGIINIRTKQPTETPQSDINFYSGVYSNFGDTDSEGNKKDTAGNYYRPLKWKEGGSSTFSGFHISHLQKIKKTGVGIQVVGFNDEGYRQGETEQRLRANFQLNRFFNNNLKLSLSGGSMATRGGLFFLWDSDSTALQPRGGIDTSTTSLSYYTNYRFHLDPRITVYSSKGDIHELKSRLYLTDNNSITQPSSQAKSYYVEYQYQHQIDSNANVTAGLSFYRNVINSTLYNDHTGLNIAPYIQYDKTWKKLTFNAGLRVEYFKVDSNVSYVDYLIPTGIKYTDSSTTWNDTIVLAKKVPWKPIARIGLRYELTKSTSLRASVGQGYRFPSIAEMFVSTNIDLLNVFPNPELSAERGYSTEIGIKQGFQFGNFQGYVDGAVFLTEYTNMMEFSFGFYAPDSLNPPYQLAEFFSYTGFKSINVGKARVSGFDLSMAGSGNIGQIGVSVLAGYTFMNPISLNRDSAYISTYSDTTANAPLKYRFRHLAKADFLLEYKRFYFGLSGRYNSFMQNIDRSFEEPLIPPFVVTTILPGLKEYRQGYLKGDLVVDARLGYQFNTSTIAIVINNFANKLYMGRPGDFQPPRTVQIQYRIKF